MKKRILAMLLAGALTVSALPITAIAADDTSADVAVDPLTDAKWSDNVTEVDAILGDGDSYQYLHIYNLDYCEDGAIYEDKNAIMEAGHDYRLSFWYRCAPTANWPKTDSETGKGIRELRLFGNGNVNLISTYPSEGNIVGGSRLIATPEWQRATVLITPTSDQYAWFRFREGNNFEDIIPFDIYGFSLVEIDEFGYAGEEMIKYNDKIITTTNGWYIKDAKGEIVTEATYLRATAKATDSTEATLSELKLEPGRYTVSADVRMTKYDFNSFTKGSGYRYTNNNAGNVTFSGANGISVIGTLAAAVNNRWSNVSFAIDVPAAVDAGKITLTLDSALGLDINNVTITKTASYGDFVDASGNPLLTIAEGLDEDGTNEYIRFFDTDGYSDKLQYNSDVTLDTSKTYILTMDMRSAEHINWASYYDGNPGRVSESGKYERHIVLTAAGTKSKTPTILDSTWSPVTFEFTPAEDTFSILITEGGGWYGYYDFIPYDIDNLKLTEKASGDVIIEAGTAEVIGDGTNTGWYTTNAKAELATDTEFYRLENSSSFNYTGDEKIEKGIYRVSLDVRLNRFDGNDFTWANESTAKTPTNNGKVNISLKVNGTIIETVDGALSATVTNGTKTLDNAWKTIEFTLPVTETINKSDLIFTLDKASALDFRNLTVESASHLYSDEYVTLGGKFIDKISSNDNEYISGSNLRIAGDGVVYTDPSKTITAGNTYTLTFDIRSINCPDWQNTVETSGFSTRVRAELNGAKSATIKVSSEWENVSTQIIAKNDGELTLKFIEQGEWDFLPYDIDNITLVCNETGDTLIDHAMTVNNGGGTGWAPLYSSYSRPQSLPKDLKVNLITETDFYRIPSSETGNTGFVYSGDDYLEKGIYHITGDFRLAEYKKDKLEMGNHVWSSINFPCIINDNNVSYLTANINGTALRNIDGSAGGVAVTSDWTNGGFVLVVDSIGGLLKSDIEFTLSDGTALDFKNIKYIPVDDLYIDDFVTEDGTPISIINEALNTENGEIGDFDTKFARIYNITYAPNGANFKDSSVNLTAGTEYELSFWARTMPTENWPVNSKYQGSRRLYVVQTVKLATIDLLEEWTEYTIRFTPDSNTTLALSFRDGTSFDDIIPFDIDGLSLMTVDAATGEVSGQNLIENDNKLGSNGWSNSGSGIAIELLSDSEFYRVLPPSDGVSNTTVAIAKDDVLVPGTYTVRGKFRLAEPIDYNKISFSGYNVSGDNNTGKIRAYATASHTPILTEGGLTEVTINPYTWTEVVFTFETAVELNMNTILFESEGNVQLDFTEIDVELVERKVNLPDVGSGFVMMLLMLKQQNKYNGLTETDISIEKDWKVNGEKAVRINNMPKGVTSDSYISVSSRQAPDTGAAYKNNAAMVYANKQYQLTFRARTVSVTNEGQPVTWGFRVITGDGKTITANLNLTEAWNTYSFKFSPKTDTTLSLIFKGASGAEQFYPFDIDDLSVVDLSTGEELAAKSGALYSKVHSAGWSKVDYSDFTANVAVVSEGIYYSANLSEGIVYTPEEKVVLEPGKYYLSGKFRVSTMEYEKLELDKSEPGKYGHTITADNNVAGISAYFGNTRLTLSDGTDTINATTVWTTVKFPFELTEATDISGLKFVSDLDAVIYFDDLKVITNNGDNLLSDAVSKEGLASWSTSGQTLEYKVDADGTKYFSASNLINNRIGFRYETDTILEPGVYIIKGDFRTSVEGETGYVRLIAYDAPETAKITNEWRTVELYVEVSEASNLKLHICGAPMATSVQNYDFANLSIMNAADLVPVNVELYKAGNFEDPETALLGCSLFSGAKAKLTRETEDGNSFVRMSERPNEYCGIAFSLGTVAYPGVTYKISYDIRTAKEGVEMVARSYLGMGADAPLKVDGETYEGSTFMYPINNEWRHVEAVITVDSMTNLIIRISGGMDPVRDIYSFDVDNLSIVKLDK